MGDRDGDRQRKCGRQESKRQEVGGRVGGWETRSEE